MNPEVHRRALICGVTGQDGRLLAQLLATKGYEVHGTSRRPPSAASQDFGKLGPGSEVRLHAASLADTRQLQAILAEVRPQEVYYLAAQSSVARSFEHPEQAWESSAMGLVRLLKAIEQSGQAPRLLYAASGDCFGETEEDEPVREDTPFRPRSPYAAAKCAGHHALAAARLAGQFACSAFLFSHESPLRPENFVIAKIVAAAARIAAGSDERLALGGVEMIRDWGWAPEYVEAMWRMLQTDAPIDLVIATGRSHPLARVVELAFDEVGLDWRRHVDVGGMPPRPADIHRQHADPQLARDLVGWEATVDLREMVGLLVQHCVAQQHTG